MHDVTTVLGNLRRSSHIGVNVVVVSGISGGKETVDPGCGDADANTDEKLAM